MTIDGKWRLSIDNRHDILELQHIIRTQHLFLFDAEVDSGDAGVGMVEEIRELDECKFTLSLRRRKLKDLPAEGLAERVGGEVLDLEIVLLLDVLQENVDPLDRVDSMFLGDEAWSVE